MVLTLKLTSLKVWILVWDQGIREYAWSTKLFHLTYYIVRDWWTSEVNTEYDSCWVSQPIQDSSQSFANFFCEVLILSWHLFRNPHKLPKITLWILWWKNTWGCSSSNIPKPKVEVSKCFNWSNLCQCRLQIMMAVALFSEQLTLHNQGIQEIRRSGDQESRRPGD